ncbi:cellulose biosynthesis cyclic di-GMP-binding regulatory protein BcsB [Methylobacterium sp. J-068]|uniref:cellulose biosynthesis cyclic di-GMP-binding regulatory protein BcsB n=1 Tax=Methylobacterium sp. J-068 TaxID=2836649 RepID=UPI001FBB6AF6|nr:cellulose biosynthesis cyclic di-GMP-binding regulatory protein BcsB [Methylobacterium sp. J-068]MCJ2032794.1 cellulose biosynthesis cyclic di-GMP-binding regulatory protein BcsB [Methylobacterium sp. J-068]
MRTLRLLTLTAGLACAAGATAQTFSGLGPVRPLVLPQDQDGTPAIAEPRAAPRGPREPALRRLPSVTAPMRLWGENGAITWTLFATEAEARAGGRFQVGYLAAVSVLPEASTLTLTLNGKTLGATAIDGAKGLRTVSFEVPPGALSHGFNAVRVATRQRHRVDCSVAATYELWTQIDPDSTGFVSAASGLGAVADLAAASVSADGAVPIRLVQTGDRLSESGVERLLGAVQDVVLAGRFGQPSVDFGPVPEAGDGLALAVGPAEQLAKTLDLGALGPVTGPRLALFPGSPEHRPLLVATGASEADVTESLAELARLHAVPPQGTPSGLRALADAGGRRIAGGESVTLADLGIADAHVAARTHRIGFDLALPHDVMAADYDRLALDLDGSYPAGLAPGAQISVEINGSSAGSTPLARAGGERFRRRTLFLPLRLLRPGLNRVVITAELPRQEDRACPAEEAVLPERLTLFASTRLTIPGLARIARQPDLAETLSAGFPYAQGPRRPMLSVPAPDRDSMAAAATLAARLGYAAGRAIPFGFAAGRTAITGPTLIVAPARLLDAPTVKAAGLDPQSVREAWTGRENLAAMQAVGPAARRRALRHDAIAACRATPAISDAPAAARASAETGPDLGGASAVLTQAITGPGADDLVTLVTAPSAAALREAVDCLVHPRVWNHPQGRQAVLSASDGGVASWHDDRPRYVATAEASPLNLRRIAAGWLSLHAGFYGVFALLLAGCLAGSTQLLVRNLGRRSK